MGLYVGPTPPQPPPVYTTTAPPWGLAPPGTPPPVVSTAAPPQAPPAPTVPPPSWGQGPPVEYEQPAIPQAGVAESRAPSGFGAGWENFTRDNSGLLIGAGTALMANAQNPLANPMSQ